MRAQGIALVVALLVSAAAAAEAQTAAPTTSAATSDKPLPGHIGIDLQGAPLSPAARAEPLDPPDRNVNNDRAAQIGPGAIGCAQETQPSGLTPMAPDGHLPDCQ
jgi:hypothetical protein